MPVLYCDCCKAKLPFARFSLPSGVFPICRECKQFLISNRRAIDEERSIIDTATASNSCAKGDFCSEIRNDDRRPFQNHVNPLQVASTNEVSHSEIICRLRNQHMLVASGLAESGSDEDVLNFVNKRLLPVLSISPHLFAVFAHRLGKPRQDGSPRLCKLYFNSVVACDAVLSRSRNFRDKADSIFAGVRFRPSLTRSQLDRKLILEQYCWNSFSKDSTGRLPVVVHYESDGSPYLWHFLRKCRINLPSSTSTTLVSLESVSISTDKATVYSGSNEVFRAELAVQTENDASLFPSVSASIGPGVVTADRGVQTDIQDDFFNPFTPNELAGSQSEISERGPWTDDDGDDDQWQDYNSDSYTDRKEKFEQEEIAFQKRASARLATMQPLTEEERLLDSRDLPLHPTITTEADSSLEVLNEEEQLPVYSSENLSARLAVLEERQKCGWPFQ